MRDAEAFERGLRDRAVLARSARLNRPPCAVRPISTTVSTVKAKVPTAPAAHSRQRARVARRRCRRAALVEPHSPAGGRQAQHRLEQRGLAAAIGAEQAQHLALAHARVEAHGRPCGRCSRWSDRDAFELTTSSSACCASSQMKNGVPMNAVSTPSGISIGADGARQRVDRAGDSRRRGAPPPAAAARNPGPTSERARCGITRPIQPMMPVTATLADVVSVAAATITAKRARPVATPSACASSSPSDITFMRQRSSDKRHEAERTTARKQRQQIGTPDRGKAAQEPEGNGGKLIVGIGEIFDNADARAEQRADHDAGEHQHQDRIVARAPSSR